ncbi:17155_t:CDS:2 [Racocetra persica]|uniref:17155_t:CDS:1 n=1 Tax=Racocetra persica TaxID=160502 RepID=A0ACA9K809_9GLOM|nr:17155_t:CDS:2 [Racocetra persica]
MIKLKFAEYKVNDNVKRNSNELESPKKIIGRDAHWKVLVTITGTGRHEANGILLDGAGSSSYFCTLEVSSDFF